MLKCEKDATNKFSLILLFLSFWHWPNSILKSWV